MATLLLSSVCPDRKPNSFVGATRKQEWKLWCGKPGDEITTAEGKQAARSVAIELLATLQVAIGDLNDVRRIVKLLVFVNSGPHFAEAHMVANGASELFIEVFEERGAPAPQRLGRVADSVWLLR